MSYVDENGVEHVESIDPVTVWGTAHIASCPRCKAAHGGVPLAATLPVASSGAEAEAMLDAGAEAVIITRSHK